MKTITITLRIPDDVGVNVQTVADNVTEPPIYKSSEPAPPQTLDNSPAPDSTADEEVTVETLKQNFVALVASGKKTEALGALRKFGVKKFDDMPEDKYGALNAALEELL